MSKIRLKVSQKSINIAQKYQFTGKPPSRTCVIAIALKRKFPNEKEVTVGTKGAYVGNKIYKLTKKAQEVIRTFDNGGKVKPFETTITEL